MSQLTRRHLLQQGGALALLLSGADLAWGATILAVRVWPAAEYTRVTIESDTALKTEPLFIANPPRLAVDIDGVELNPALKELVGKVKSDDPYIIGVRVGQFSPNKVRLVLDLRQMVKPQVFSLQPVNVGGTQYQHRLVLDLYPTKIADPLEALIQERLQNSPSMTATPSANTQANKKDPLDQMLAQKPANNPPLFGNSDAPAANATANTATSSPNSGASTQAKAVDAPSLTPSPGVDRFIIIALDPGHGGEDPGATGSRGTREKDVVLQIAHKLRALIDSSSVKTKHGELPMRAFMTRETDFFVPLYTRVEKARRVQADLFVSIHADAFFTPEAKGASVFALSPSGASSAAARWMAKQENRADQVGGLNIKTQDATVQRALLDMSTTAQINDSLKLGGEMLGQIKRVAQLHKGQVEQAGFAVLKAPDIPSVLVETAFISNPDEENKLISEAYQNDLAQALVKGIKRYFSRNPPLSRTQST